MDSATIAENGPADAIVGSLTLTDPDGSGDQSHFGLRRASSPSIRLQQAMLMMSLEMGTMLLSIGCKTRS